MVASTLTSPAKGQALFAGDCPALDVHDLVSGRASTTARIETSDMQGLVLRGYKGLPYASYHVLRIDDAKRARAYLARLVESVSRGEPASRDAAVQVAFTHAGLVQLDLPAPVLAGFSREFISGMVDEERSRYLGDEGQSAPTQWQWGGPQAAPVHAIVMLYAKTSDDLASMQADHEQAWSTAGFAENKRLVAGELSRLEHFGFADGISQPAIDGYHPTESELHQVKAGEFVLGYENEYQQYTGRPLVTPEQDPHAILPLDVEGTGQHDFGRNGSYIAFRHLYQNVPLFHAMLREATRKVDGSPDLEAEARLAAKMVGRWPSGAPLVTAPDRDLPALGNDNEFRYHDADPDGLRCPIGSHVRRTNPRDSLAPAPGTSRSLSINRRHRLLRRGRSYGPPFTGPNADAEDRGILFIGVCGNIQRQFEFIQHTWINNPRFAGLYGDADPIVGPGNGNSFTVASNPVREKYVGLPRFVEVRGGAYLFMPGIRALRYLAER